MRHLSLLGLLSACSLPDDAPTCLNNELHTCPTVEVMQSCNAMMAWSGLSVTFSGGAPVAYDAVVSIDGRETSFSCDETTGPSVTDGSVLSCSSEGFWVVDHGDAVTITVTADGATTTRDYEPCWDATEPNGECCGWNYRADVEFALDG